MKKSYLIKCENCNEEFSLNLTEKQFNNHKHRKSCSSSCSASVGNRKKSVSSETKNLISISLVKFFDNKPKFEYNYQCEDCNCFFIRKDYQFKKGRKIRCDDCIQKRKKFIENPDSILELSTRTVSKIIKRSGKGCSICGWNESTCDIHHIIPRSKGGNNDLINLILICPNCHRIAHTIEKYSKDYLISKSFLYDFPNWKDFYNVSN